MDTYIVRIYRRNNSDPNSLAGLVEIPGVPEKKVFKNINDLLSILIYKKKVTPSGSDDADLPQR